MKSVLNITVASRIAVLVAMTILSACGGGVREGAYDTAVPVVDEKFTNFFLHFWPASDVLQPREEAAFAQFLSNVPRDHLKITITIPDTAQKQVRLARINELLRLQNIGRADVEVVWLAAAVDPDQVGVNASTAHLSLSKACPDWDADPTSNHENYPHPNFGCGMWGAISRQISDPRDLVRGHGTVAQDPYRNNAALTGYSPGVPGLGAPAPAPVAPTGSAFAQ